MQTHPQKGRAMIDEIINNFELCAIEQVDILRNIAEFHHEAVNGSGYPSGKAGDDIPPEARIVAVADVFDALTSSRPYKAAWSNDKAFEKLLEMAGRQLDRECVEALLSKREWVEAIQAHFQEDMFG